MTPLQTAVVFANVSADLGLIHSSRSDLGTLCRNEVRIDKSEHTFPRLTTATELQATAFELLGIKPK